MMWGKHRSDKGHETNGLVAIAIDKDKGSQYALKWTLDHLLEKGETAILVHVNQRISTLPNPNANHVSVTNANGNVAHVTRDLHDSTTREIFLPFRVFCTRKEIKCTDVILEDTDIAKAIIDYVSRFSIEILVLGACSKNGLLRRLRTTDVPSAVSKGAPDFCSVYVIGKGKITSVRHSSRQAPALSPSRDPIQSLPSMRSSTSSVTSLDNGPSHPHSQASTFSQASLPEDDIRSPFARARGPNARPYGEISMPEMDISFISSNRPSTDRMLFPSLYDHLETGRPNNRPPRLMHMDDDALSNHSFESPLRTPAFKSLDRNSMEMYSGISQDSGRTSWSSQSLDELEAEMKWLKLELKQTMDKYSTVCQEAVTHQQKAKELQLWKIEEEQRLEEAKNAQEAALAIAEKEKMKCRAAMEAAEAAQRTAEQEAQKRMNAEMKALKESEENKKALQALAYKDVRYRKYSIEEIELATDFFHEKRKIGEGGYGPVYKCYLDHTPVAVKVLRPESAAQGRMQFQQEVEVLSCIRHPNMVLLLGACPDYGCLVYEYLANGSLDDRLFCRENTQPLSWQLRFRIACEIATGLLFLHQTKPEPLVHRDLKPGNILLDRNFISKISDVGLARLVPPNVANHVTQYRMTSTAGTFCYIDPEYQQTGMLGIKSDVYSLGIMLLQIITAKSPMGLTHLVEKAIERGTFEEMLDPAVRDWPVEEAMKFAKLSLQCAELRRKDRPDLGLVVLPELERLRALAEQHMPHYHGSAGPSPNHSFASYPDIMSDPQIHCNPSSSPPSIHGRSSVN